MIKRLISTLACLCLLAGAITPVLAAEPQSGVLALLGELNIMQGDPNGDMRLDDPVTRAEFTKAAVASSSFRNSVASNLAISPFPDVTYQHWAAPYVRVGVTNGLVSGYPDATFQPDSGVLYEEAITIMLRVLGYTDADFGVSWPYGQLGMAGNLDMTDHIDCSAGQVMDRGQVAQLIYNTLCAKMKDQSVQLVSLFDVQLLEDVTLIADNKDDPSIASDEIFTSGGTLKTNAGFDRSALGRKGDAAVKNGNKLIAFMPAPDSSANEEFVVYSVLTDTVIAYQNGSMTQIDIDGNTTVYKGKSQTSFSAIMPTLEMGDKLKVKKTGNDIDYVTWQKGSLEGPVTVMASGWGGGWGVSDSTTVMRDGLSSSYADLQTYDVAYYLKDLNLVLAYSDKVTGVYEQAAPNKDMPTKITISGKEYELEGGAAFSKLSSGGEFSFGDTITVLLGKDGKIADVVSSSASTGGNLVGYVIETGRKEFNSGAVDTYTSYYVKVVFPDGTTNEYATDRDYKECKNAVSEITISGGYARLSLLRSTGGGKISGIFNWQSRRLGSTPVSDSAAILDIGTQGTYDTSVYARVYPQRLDNVNISASQILYAESDSTGAITKLILKNVTGDGFRYGLMTSSSKLAGGMMVGGSYTYLIDGQFYDLTLSGRMFNITSGSGIQVGGQVSNPDTIIKLNELTLTTGPSSISASKLLTADKSYPISASVSVYQKSSSISSTYVKIPLTDVAGKKDLKISAYYDKEPASGGQIRVIVVY